MVGCVSGIMDISLDLNESDDDRFSQLVDEVEIKYAIWIFYAFVVLLLQM